MTTIDEHDVLAPTSVCFDVATDVTRWPEILPHYRWVRVHGEAEPGVPLVEMAAWRPFAGPLRYPTWWMSEMRVDPAEPAVHYRHVRGITRGMIVKWEFHPTARGTRVRIVHEWSGPAWPLIGRAAADLVIGPHFVSAIAGRTLAGVAREAERRVISARTSGDAL
ncbi:MAG TPA: SRPBCC family protein [Longimicrobiales bacterium]|nr:SRPBCC family protein [Longimicrobiales bacterium]